MKLKYSVLNHLLISRCDDVCDWNGPSVVLTPDQATQKRVVKSTKEIACDDDIVKIERMDANWLRNFDNLFSGFLLEMDF